MSPSEEPEIEVEIPFVNVLLDQETTLLPGKNVLPRVLMRLLL
jgi:hypothetical protein